jgi:alkylation response protein AidB-like acyl-CoA dehydrogenase
VIELQLNETQRMVRDLARKIARERVAPVAAANDRDERFPREQLRELAQAGLFGVNVPEAYGGAAAGVVAYAVAMMEVSAACASTAVAMAVSNMVAEVICAFGSEEQKQKHVTRLTSGEYAAASFALSEPASGSDAGGLLTTARRVDGGWVLDGQKQWITSGAHAGVIVVWARTGGHGNAGISAFLVESGTPGLEVGKPEDKLGLRASNTVPLTFDGCRIPADALLGEENTGFRIAMMALDGGRIGIASQSVGIAEAALAAAADYARGRKQFGKPIGEFQAIQWMLADSRTELDAARLLTLRAASLKEKARPFSREASMAKLYASEAVNRITARALQIHGGYGYVKDYPVERYLRDARVTTIYEGTSEVQRMVIARKVIGA